MGINDSLDALTAGCQAHTVRELVRQGEGKHSHNKVSIIFGCKGQIIP